MGNTTSGKRHNSGEDTGLNVTAMAKASVSENLTSPRGGYDGYKRSRSTTLSPQLEKLPPTFLPTVFKWEGGGEEVYLSGSFNNWKKQIPLSRSHGDFYTILDLPEGKHEYKFFVDGQWQHDPSEPVVSNESGFLNNVVSVKKSDFEVFEALALDSISMKKHHDISNSPPGDYSQEIPNRKPTDKHGGPPILPPHLLQVILNKDTPAHCEPSLLPEPHHVMLNHLYALSIKDGVMVLSATHRFRKKYVTTLLYRPIE